MTEVILASLRTRGGKKKTLLVTSIRTGYLERADGEGLASLAAGPVKMETGGASVVVQ